MELDYYLFKTKITQRAFAKKIGIMPHRLSVIVNRKASPSLVTAIKINAATEGKVSYQEMVRDRDRLEE